MSSSHVIQKMTGNVSKKVSIGMKTASDEKKTCVRWCSAFLIVLGLAFCTERADAQFGRPATQVKLAAAILPATDKLPVRLAITATIDEGWHIYSVTQAKGGPRPTKLQLVESSDYELVGDFTSDTAPVIHEYEFWPDLKVEEHTGSVTWTVPLKLGPGVDLAGLTVGVNAKGQVCSDERCNNFKKSLSATVK